VHALNANGGRSLVSVQIIGTSRYAWRFSKATTICVSQPLLVSKSRRIEVGAEPNPEQGLVSPFIEFFRAG